MCTQITGWKTSYNVETPAELRASIADLDDAGEIETRREIASKWEQFADRIPIVQAALNEYDWAAERDALPV